MVLSQQFSGCLEGPLESGGMLEPGLGVGGPERRKLYADGGDSRDSSGCMG